MHVSRPLATGHAPVAETASLADDLQRVCAMLPLFVVVGSFLGFIVAYHTYGRWLARRIFQLDPQAEVPSRQLQDNVDFVPTRRQVIFGHHFTSIAGTGPIVPGDRRVLGLAARPVVGVVRVNLDRRGP